MVDPDRRPTAHEIEELIDLVRRDPGSPAFIDLGEAYLALGRPRDAVQVGNIGIEHAPDSLEGRVLLARAHAALHQWKDAQGELLRVVKVDRGNRVGFALLGEVLLRRSDYERAVPVLQHAQNLDPTSPAILAMLRRARAGQPLDPPPPVPTPVPPRGETANPAEVQRSRPGPPPAAGQGRVPMAGAAMPTMAIDPAGPTHVPAGPAPGPSFHAGAYLQPAAMATVVAEPSPQRAAAPAGPIAGGAAALAQTVAAPGPGAMPPPLSPAPQASAPRPTPKTAPPPMSVEGIRPRVISSQKQQNAAAASLRQSASVGENYLNELLTGGLLDVAGVRVPDVELDLRPDRRWGRSTRRAFAFLFIVLFLGIGGGGTWYWWSEKQRAESVARLQRDAKKLLGHGELGSYDPELPETNTGIEAALGKLNEALKLDKSNALTFAYVVEVTGLEALLYGTELDRVDRAYKAIAKEIAPDAPGARELVIGKAAADLARIHALDPQPAATTLSEVHKALDAYLAKHEADRWARWLKGRALLVAGQRSLAATELKAAGDGEAGLAVAQIDRADLLVDDGKLEQALALYKEATAKAKDHPLAVLGRSLGRAEALFEDEQVIPELNEKFNVAKLPARPAAYRSLALALANIALGDYAKAIDALKKAEAAGTALGEPRFWARVAWAHLQLGDLARASQARLRVVWLNKRPEIDPTVQLIDAGFFLASGLPEKALDLAARLEGPRPRLLRAQAYLDLGKYADAIAEAEGLLKTAPQSLEASIFAAQARLMAATERDRAELADALEKLARRATGKLGRHALGVGWLTAGDLPNAKLALEAAITDVSETSPNPVAYRTLTALAEVALAEQNLVGAGKFLDWALDGEAARRPELTLSKGSIRALDANKQRTPYADYLKANSGYFPTRAMQARVVLRNQEPDRALDLLGPILAEPAAVTAAVKLTHAEALITHKKATAQDKDRAKALIVELAAAKSAPLGEVARVAALLDPRLVKELELPQAADEPDEAAPRGGRPGGRRR
jgi:tetratricopeptide (TPR) repeat protein